MNGLALYGRNAIDELIDPILGDYYTEHEVHCMLHASSLCTRRDPHTRPRMLQVLRILKGDVVMESNYISTPGYEHGNRSGHCSAPILHEASKGFVGKLSYEAIMRATWEREREGRTCISRRRGSPCCRGGRGRRDH